MSEEFSQNRCVSRILEIRVNHVLAEIEKGGEKRVSEFFCSLACAVGLAGEK